MPRPERKLRCAVVGRSPLLEEELFSLLKKEGAGESSIVSFDESPGGTSIDIDDNEECRIYLPLSEEYLTDFDAIFLLTDSRQAVNSAEKAAAGTRAVILDLSGGKGNGRGCERVPPTEPFLISTLLKAAGTGKVKSFSWTLYESASVEGEKGVRELFSQTASILNFKKPKTEVFKEQVAFNILPRTPGTSGNIESGVRELAGYTGFISRAVVQIPVFHGSSISFLLETSPGPGIPLDAFIEAFEREPIFSRLTDISDFYRPEQRTDIQYYIERVGEDRIWGWIRFDKFKSHAALAVERMAACLGKKGGTG